MSTVPMPAPELTVGRQGHYAGAVSRLLGFGADVGVSWGVFSVGVLLVNAALKLVTGHSYTFGQDKILTSVILAVWEFVYFAYQWAVSGKTLGMAVFGIQVVNTRGGPITNRQSVLRTLGLGLCLLLLGIPFLGIVYQRERRALDDFLAGTAVVYDWDARAARLRWMARSKGPQHHGVEHKDHAA